MGKHRRPAVLENLGGSRTVNTIGKIDGKRHVVEIGRAIDARTAYATTRPDPGMSKAEWWAVKNGRKRSST